ncbi:Mimitin, mitochondrial [Operophtera brumata]|uniref:Mimitin, mitochondrial n=1 Tax=Operophtera brumata TaxID=104452 RepID=A0A0L7KSC4_OPEBR|nr:Mimitin, mitochondrial [Operophtera brumata]
MDMAGESRYVWRIVFKNFINSFRPRQIRGNDMGKDYIGNQYYEIPADPSSGKRKATQLKKVNAGKIEAKRLADGGSLPTLPEKGAQSFPAYSEYHSGELPKKD